MVEPRQHQVVDGAVGYRANGLQQRRRGSVRSPPVDVVPRPDDQTLVVAGEFGAPVRRHTGEVLCSAGEEGVIPPLEVEHRYLHRWVALPDAELAPEAIASGVPEPV